MDIQLSNAYLSGKRIVFMKTKDMNKACETVYQTFRGSIIQTANTKGRKYDKLNLCVYKKSVNYRIVDESCVTDATQNAETLVEAELSAKTKLLRKAPTLNDLLNNSYEEIVNSLRPKDGTEDKQIHDIFTQDVNPRDNSFIDINTNTIYLLPYIHEFSNLFAVRALLTVVETLDNRYVPDGNGGVRPLQFIFVLVVPEDYEVPESLKDVSIIIEPQLPTKDEILHQWVSSMYDSDYWTTVKRTSQESKAYASNDIINAFLECSTVVEQLSEQDESNLYRNPRFISEVVNRQETQMFLKTFSGLSENEIQNTIDETKVAIIRGVDNARKPVEFKTLQEILEFLQLRQIKTINQSPAVEYMPSVEVSELGGMNQVKEYIDRMAVCMTPEAQAFGIDKPKGIALIGVSGTGKSLGAKVIASKLNYGLLRLNLSALLGGIVGSTEQNTLKALRIIESLGNVVVLIDEIDKSINMNTGSGDSGVGERLLQQLLTFMQESDSGLVWVFTANRVKNLPGELMRQGRLDQKFGVTFPQPQERLEVLKIHLKKRKQDLNNIDKEILNMAVKDTENYVSAELEGLVKEALVNCFLDGKKVLEYSHFKKAIRETRILYMDKNIRQDLSEIQEWIKESARPAHIEVPTESQKIKTSKNVKPPSRKQRLQLSEFE